MASVELNTHAPDFELADFNGKPFRLSDARGKQVVVLIFNRGFQ